jgi:hypothetical protein
MWLRAAGVDDVEVDRGPRFNRASLVIESAIFGRGVALAKSTLAAAERAKRSEEPGPDLLSVFLPQILLT